MAKILGFKIQREPKDRWICYKDMWLVVDKDKMFVHEQSMAIQGNTNEHLASILENFYRKIVGSQVEMKFVPLFFLPQDRHDLYKIEGAVRING